MDAKPQESKFKILSKLFIKNEEVPHFKNINNMMVMIDKMEPIIIDQLDFNVESSICAPNPLINYEGDEQLWTLQKEYKINIKIQKLNTEGARQYLLDTCLIFDPIKKTEEIDKNLSLLEKVDQIADEKFNKNDFTRELLRNSEAAVELPNLSKQIHNEIVSLNLNEKVIIR